MTMYLRTLSDARFTTTDPDEITWPQEDGNFIEIADRFDRLENIAGLTPYDPLVNYQGNVDYIVGYNGQAYIYVSAGNHTGVTPGTDNTVWQLIDTGTVQFKLNVTLASFQGQLVIGTLLPGRIYYITDKKWYIQALEINAASRGGIARELVPMYEVHAMWLAGDTVVTNEKRIYNKLVYRSLTGVNTLVDPQTDTTNWLLITPDPDINVYRYITMDVIFNDDFSDIVQYRDGMSNVLDGANHDQNRVGDINSNGNQCIGGQLHASKFLGDGVDTRLNRNIIIGSRSEITLTNISAIFEDNLFENSIIEFFDEDATNDAAIVWRSTFKNTTVKVDLTSNSNDETGFEGANIEINAALTNDHGANAIIEGYHPLLIISPTKSGLNITHLMSNNVISTTIDRPPAITDFMWDLCGQVSLFTNGSGNPIAINQISAFNVSTHGYSKIYKPLDFVMQVTIVALSSVSVDFQLVSREDAAGTYNIDPANGDYIEVLETITTGFTCNVIKIHQIK